MAMSSSESGRLEYSDLEEQPPTQRKTQERASAAAVLAQRSSNQQHRSTMWSEQSHASERSTRNAYQQGRPRAEAERDHPRRKKRKRVHKERGGPRNEDERVHKQFRRRDDEEEAFEKQRRRRDHTDARERGEQVSDRDRNALPKGHASPIQAIAPTIHRSDFRNVVRLFSFGWMPTSHQMPLYESSWLWDTSLPETTSSQFNTFKQRVFMTRESPCTRQWRDDIIENLKTLRVTRLTIGDEFEQIDDRQVDQCLTRWALRHAIPEERLPQVRDREILVAIANAFGCLDRVRQIVKKGLKAFQNDFQNVRGNVNLLKAFFAYVEAIEAGALAAQEKKAQEKSAIRDARERARSETVDDERAKGRSETVDDERGKGSSGKAHKQGKGDKSSFPGKAERGRNRYSAADNEGRNDRSRNQPWNWQGNQRHGRCDSADAAAGRDIV